MPSDDENEPPHVPGRMRHTEHRGGHSTEKPTLGTKTYKVVSIEVTVDHHGKSGPNPSLFNFVRDIQLRSLRTTRTDNHWIFGLAPEGFYSMNLEHSGEEKYTKGRFALFLHHGTAKDPVDEGSLFIVEKEIKAAAGLPEGKIGIRFHGNGARGRSWEITCISHDVPASQKTSSPAPVEKPEPAPQPPVSATPEPVVVITTPPTLPPSTPPPVVEDSQQKVVKSETTAAPPPQPQQPKPTEKKAEREPMKKSTAFNLKLFTAIMQFVCAKLGIEDPQSIKEGSNHLNAKARRLVCLIAASKEGLGQPVTACAEQFEDTEGNVYRNINKCRNKDLATDAKLKEWVDDTVIQLRKEYSITATSATEVPAESANGHEPAPAGPKPTAPVVRKKRVIKAKKVVVNKRKPRAVAKVDTVPSDIFVRLVYFARNTGKLSVAEIAELAEITEGAVFEGLGRAGELYTADSSPTLKEAFADLLQAAKPHEGVH
ncbi:MAG: hypothetical protein RIT04_328 [Candidatus Parcubacteria bacterium]|jgi:outer membrane biosynthesis protein TonB